MKYKLLAVSKFPNISGVNIGDYVQALASSQFLPHIDGFIDRDEDLKDYAGEPCKVIMNGWYMHLPQNWPPSDLIDPLFVAFHLNSGVKEVLLSSQSIAYLKSHQPIGCRDLNTLYLLSKNGVDAYFSGCMTLTLGEKYHSEEKEDKTSAQEKPAAILFFALYPIKEPDRGKRRTGGIWRCLPPWRRAMRQEVPTDRVCPEPDR